MKRKTDGEPETGFTENQIRKRTENPKTDCGNPGTDCGKPESDCESRKQTAETGIGSRKAGSRQRKPETGSEV